MLSPRVSRLFADQCSPSRRGAKLAVNWCLPHLRQVADQL